MDHTGCKCNCGYSCGGPGVCQLETMDCIEQHFKKDCEHDFSGPMVPITKLASSVVCQKCSLSAMGHDEMVGP